MMIYAQLNNGVVVGVSRLNEVHESLDLIELTEFDADLIGSTYANGIFSPAIEAPAPVAPWSKKDFLLKFTPSEYGAIKSAASVNPEIDYYWTLFNVAGDVLKTDQVTIEGIQALESAGLLAEGRAAEILQ